MDLAPLTRRIATLESWLRQGFTVAALTVRGLATLGSLTVTGNITAAALLLGTPGGGWTPYTGTLADDASLTLTGENGFFFIREHTGNSLGIVRAGYGGAAVVVSSGFTINTTDTDGNWCFFWDTDAYKLRNRTGGARTYTVYALSMS